MDGKDNQYRDDIEDSQKNHLPKVIEYMQKAAPHERFPSHMGRLDFSYMKL